MNQETRDLAKRQASETAREWLHAGPIFLDVETTGLSVRAQVCQLAVLDAAGRTLLDALVCPKVEIDPGAAAVHGLTNAALRDALALEALLEPLTDLLRGRQVVAWNAEFDARLLTQSGARAAVDLAGAWLCAMRLHAAWFGDWDDRRCDWRWQKLVAAARTLNLAPYDAHTARADADICRRIIKAIAE